MTAPIFKHQHQRIHFAKWSPGSKWVSLWWEEASLPSQKRVSDFTVKMGDLNRVLEASGLVEIAWRRGVVRLHCKLCDGVLHAMTLSKPMSRASEVHATLCKCERCHAELFASHPPLCICPRCRQSSLYHGYDK